MIEVILGSGIYFGLYLIRMSLIERKNRSRRVLEKYLANSEDFNKDSRLRIFEAIRPLLTSHTFNPWGSDTKVAIELAASGRNVSVPQFRISQIVTLLWLLFGIVGWHFLRYLVGHPVPMLVTTILLVAAVPFSGFAQLNFLQGQVRHRSEIIEGELAGMLDLLAFSVTSGEPIVGAISRVGQVCDGLIAQIFRKIMHQISDGVSINSALSDAIASTSSNSFARAVRGIQTAIERGTPLANLLRAQANDVRANCAAAHMKSAGKREAAMMIPVVFLILPMIVIITLYPGLSALQIN